MQKQFVTYEIALKLKELGFDEECINEYWFTCEKLRFSFESIKNIYHYKRSNSDNNDISLISAPLWQQVIDWFREKHNIHIEIELTDNTMQFYYQYCIVDSKNRECHDEDMIDQATRIYNYNERFNTYEEAREQAILKTIELCQKEK